MDRQRHRGDRHGQTDRETDRQTDRRQDKTGIMVMKINCRLDSSHKIHLYEVICNTDKTLCREGREAQVQWMYTNKNIEKSPAWLKSFACYHKSWQSNSTKYRQIVPRIEI